jgi:hypothetical protein
MTFENSKYESNLSIARGGSKALIRIFTKCHAPGIDRDIVYAQVTPAVTLIHIYMFIGSVEHGSHTVQYRAF